MPHTAIGRHGFSIHIDDSFVTEETDSAFSYEELPPIPVAYFTGPQLPQFHTQELLDYCRDYSYSAIGPIKDRKTRDKIIAGLTSLVSRRQGNLFANTQEDLDSTFDELIALRKAERPLYRQWTMNNGKKERTLSTPQKPLEHLLKEYVLPIVMQAPLHPSAHGGENGWSVKDSLAQHVPIGTALSFDLTSAFVNCGIQYVFDFYYTFLRGKIDDTRVARDLAGFLATASTVRYKEEHTPPGLPQGSPLSVALFNRLFHPVDSLIAEKCKKRGLTYTRWIDDLVITGRERDRRFDRVAGVMSLVREDFPIAAHKIFWQQDQAQYYLLGHKILGKMIVPVKEDGSKNQGEPIRPENFNNSRDWENWDDLIEDDFNVNDSSIPF